LGNLAGRLGFLISVVHILGREPLQPSQHDRIFSDSCPGDALLDSFQLLLPAVTGSPARQSARERHIVFKAAEVGKPARKKKSKATLGER
jgi:hypothetical protein